MLNLIIKDLMIQKKTLLFALGYTIFVFIIFNMPTFKEVVYIMGPVAVAYMAVMSANALDERNKSEVILNSLPIKRKSIVMAKYAAVLLYIALALIVSGLAGVVLKAIGLPFPARYINLVDIASAYLSVLLMLSIYYPAYFKFGSQFLRVINIVLFMVAFFAPSYLIGYYMKNSSSPLVVSIASIIKGIPEVLLLLLILLFVAMIFLGSMLVSVKIYNNKEF